MYPRKFIIISLLISLFAHKTAFAVGQMDTADDLIDYNSCVEEMQSAGALQPLIDSLNLLLAQEGDKKLAEEAHGDPAGGSPPGQIDDPFTPGPNNWEVNLFSTYTRSATARDIEGPVFDVNYGIGDRIELSAELPVLIHKEDGEPTIKGIGKLHLGVKYEFLDQDKDNAFLSASIYPSIGVNLSKASVDKGLEDPGTEIILPVEISKTMGKLTLSGEFGYHHIGDDITNEAFGGVGVGYDVTDNLQVMLDARADQPIDGTHGTVMLGAGLGYTINDNLALFASVGHTIYNPKGEGEFTSLFGLRFTFDSTKPQ